MSRSFKRQPPATVLSVAERASLTRMKRKLAKAERRRQGRIRGLKGLSVREAIRLAREQ